MSSGCQGRLEFKSTLFGFIGRRFFFLKDNIVKGGWKKKKKRGQVYGSSVDVPINTLTRTVPLPPEDFPKKETVSSKIQ